jgi:hypothetical protein
MITTTVFKAWNGAAATRYQNYDAILRADAADVEVRLMSARRQVWGGSREGWWEHDLAGGRQCDSAEWQNRCAARTSTSVASGRDLCYEYDEFALVRLDDIYLCKTTGAMPSPRGQGVNHKGTLNDPAKSCPVIWGPLPVMKRTTFYPFAIRSDDLPTCFAAIEAL